MDKKHTRSPTEPATAYSHEFWENYTLFLVKQGVSQKYVTWYVLRTKQYIAYFPDQHIRTHSAQQVEEYLNKVGREINLKAWQFGQVVDAIRILFCLALKQGWAHDFDWEYWSASAKKLEADHATVARDYTDALEALEGLEPKKSTVVGLLAFYTSTNPTSCMM